MLKTKRIKKLEKHVELLKSLNSDLYEQIGILTEELFNAIFKFKGVISMNELIDKIHRYTKPWWNDDGHIQFYYGDNMETFHRHQVVDDLKKFFKIDEPNIWYNEKMVKEFVEDFLS